MKIPVKEKKKVVLVNGGIHKQLITWWEEQLFSGCVGCSFKLVMSQFPTTVFLYLMLSVLFSLHFYFLTDQNLG